MATLSYVKPIMGLSRSGQLAFRERNINPSGRVAGICAITVVLVIADDGSAEMGLFVACFSWAIGNIVWTISALAGVMFRRVFLDQRAKTRPSVDVDRVH
jgi:hypothetical protein